MSNLGTAKNVRFEEEIERRLDAVAARFSVGSSLLIRTAVREYLDKIENADSLVITAPLRLNETDARSQPSVETEPQKVSYQDDLKKARKSRTKA